jgi:hypothetical protein
VGVDRAFFVNFLLILVEHWKDSIQQLMGPFAEPLSNGRLPTVYYSKRKLGDASLNFYIIAPHSDVATAVSRTACANKSFQTTMKKHLFG